MTRNELKRERAIEKARGRIVRAEILRTKRMEQIKKHIDTIMDIMTVIMLILLAITAFVIDAFDFCKIPTWIYVAGIIYLMVYIILNYKRFTK